MSHLRIIQPVCCVFMAPKYPGLNRQWPGRSTGTCQVLRYHSLLGLTLRKQSHQRVLLLLSHTLSIVCLVVMAKVQSMLSINHVAALQTVCPESAHPRQECAHTPDLTLPIWKVQRTPPSRARPLSDISDATCSAIYLSIESTVYRGIAHCNVLS